jgi:crotonobetainyl-CoA:carnitine CoA-transferase CaiB-like acyl-CoA transferase
LAAALAKAFAAGNADVWEPKLTRAGAGCVRADGPVAGEFWLPDAHIRENNFVRPMRHLRYGDLHRHAPLLEFSEAETRSGAAVLAGEHTDALLRELGYAEPVIAALRAEGVVWSEPVDVDEAFGEKGKAA